jgi:hypothetical protein
LAARPVLDGEKALPSLEIGWPPEKGSPMAEKGSQHPPIAHVADGSLAGDSATLRQKQIGFLAWQTGGDLAVSPRFVTSRPLQDAGCERTGRASQLSQGAARPWAASISGGDKGLSRCGRRAQENLARPLTEAAAGEHPEIKRLGREMRLHRQAPRTRGHRSGPRPGFVEPWPSTRSGRSTRAATHCFMFAR